MNERDLERLNNLQRLSGEAHQRLQDVSEQMRNLAEKPNLLPDDRWDALFQAWENHYRAAQRLGDEISRSYDEAMKRG